MTAPPWVHSFKECSYGHYQNAGQVLLVTRAPSGRHQDIAVFIYFVDYSYMIVTIATIMINYYYLGVYFKKPAEFHATFVAQRPLS